MALIDRVHERVETDLSDDELQAMIDGVAAEIDARFGPNAEQTRHYRGGDRLIALFRPLDEGQPIAVVEIDAAGEETALDAADWRLLDEGRTLERLATGPNGRGYWDAMVRVTATPVSDARQRDEVILKIVQLDITYRGLDKQESAGDYSRSGWVTSDAYTKERDALINQLAPRRGLAMA